MHRIRYKKLVNCLQRGQVEHSCQPQNRHSKEGERQTFTKELNNAILVISALDKKECHSDRRTSSRNSSWNGLVVALGDGPCHLGRACRFSPGAISRKPFCCSGVDQTGEWLGARAGKSIDFGAIFGGFCPQKTTNVAARFEIERHFPYGRIPNHGKKPGISGQWKRL
jgi:hypothetical protein